MRLLTVYHPISRAERVPQIQHFICNLRVKPIRCRTVRQSRDLYKLSELPLIFLIHQSKVMQHFSSNECLSSWYIIPLFAQREYLKFDISCTIWESTSAEMKWCGQLGTCRCCQKLLISTYLNHISIYRGVWITSAAMDTSTGSKSSRFPVQGGHPILTYLAFFCVQIESQP